MKFIDVIIGLFLLILVGSVLFCLFKNRKKGYCYGCPYYKGCNKNNCLKGK